MSCTRGLEEYRISFYKNKARRGNITDKVRQPLTFSRVITLSMKKIIRAGTYSMGTKGILTFLLSGTCLIRLFLPISLNKEECFYTYIKKRSGENQA